MPNIWKYSFNISKMFKDNNDTLLLFNNVLVHQIYVYIKKPNF